jgi:hypothetical protein
MPEPVRHVYIYYQIDPAQADLAATRIGLLLSAMAPYCSQPPRRLNRCNDAATWMEIYAGVANLEMFSAALDRALRTINCAEFTLGVRHRECFTEPAPAP